MKPMNVEGWDEGTVNVPESAAQVAMIRRLLELEARNHSGSRYEITIDTESAPENGWFKCYWTQPSEDPMGILDAPQVAGLAAVYGDYARVAWRTEEDCNIGFEYRPRAVIAWSIAR